MIIEFLLADVLKGEGDMLPGSKRHPVKSVVGRATKSVISKRMEGT